MNLRMLGPWMGAIRPLICGVGLRGYKKCPRRCPMSMPSEQHDYITGSVAGILTLLIIVAGLAFAAAWFSGF